MIQKEITDTKLLDLFNEIEKDGITTFLMENRTIRGTLLHGTRMINRMRANHETGILETLALGQAYLAAGLLTSLIKGDDRIGLLIECGGPIGGITVEANAHGDIRGYLKNNPVEITEEPESFDLSPYFGPGFLSVTRYLQSAKQPFTGQTMLVHGSIAKDLAEYFLSSEQTKTLFFLSIQFDKTGDAVGAAGLFLQEMPGADDKTLGNIQDAALSIPSLGQYFAHGNSSESLVERYFGGFSPEIIGARKAEFFCHCTKEYFAAFLSSLEGETRESIRTEGPFPLQLRCHNCNTVYEFSKEEVQQVLGPPHASEQNSEERQSRS